MNFEVFFREEVPAYLEKLDTDSRPLWGILTPQHMVEHLVSTWRISNGKATAPLVIAEDEIPIRMKFLFSDKPFPRNIKNKLMGDSLLPLRKPDLDSAREQLLMEMKDFFDHHNANPSIKYIHPLFGELDKEGWLRFQYKHLLHHFMQFNLLPSHAG